MYVQVFEILENSGYLSSHVSTKRLSFIRPYQTPYTTKYHNTYALANHSVIYTLKIISQHICFIRTIRAKEWMMHCCDIIDCNSNKYFVKYLMIIHMSIIQGISKLPSIFRYHLSSQGYNILQILSNLFCRKLMANLYNNILLNIFKLIKQ